MTITLRDRLLAGGLLAFITGFLLFGLSDRSLQSVSMTFILCVFAIPAIVVLLPCLLRGSSLDQILAVVFALPSLILLSVIVRHLIAGSVE